MLLDPFCYLGKMLVLLSDVVFLTKVDQVDNRLGREEEKRIYDFDLRESSSQRNALFIASDSYSVENCCSQS